MTRIVPVVFKWLTVDVVDPETGEATRGKAMVPLKRYGNVAGRQYAEGEEYALEPVAMRDMHRHNHFFAALNESFKNLPETVAARWPTVEHFRKWLLIECNYFDENEFSWDDEQAARRFARWYRGEHEYARISLHRPKVDDGKWRVIIRTAKSQAVPAMKPEEFYQSKKDLLDYASGLIGTTRGELQRNAGRSA